MFYNIFMQIVCKTPLSLSSLQSIQLVSCTDEALALFSVNHDLYTSQKSTSIYNIFVQGKFI